MACWVTLVFSCNQGASGYQREEHIAAAIARSKEAHQETFMRGREEFLASAITTAFGGGGASERERGHVGGYPVKVCGNDSLLGGTDLVISLVYWYVFCCKFN